LFCFVFSFSFLNIEHFTLTAHRVEDVQMRIARKYSHQRIMTTLQEDISLSFR
jgi:hypothetical protein